MDPVTNTDSQTSHDEAMLAKFEAADAGAPAQKTEESNTPERPSWLPEKFKSPEDLAKAYDELQKKLGAPKEEPKPQEEDTTKKTDPTADLKITKPESEKEEAEKVAEKAGLDFEALSNSFQQNGGLTDADYETIEKAGIPRHLVDAYIDGQLAIADGIRQETFKVVGGEENYASMIEWASRSLSKNEIAAFDRAAEFGSRDELKLAVEGLYARYTAANGSAPQLLQGSSQASAPQGFKSTQELTAAMRDPRYASDPAYQDEVRARLAVSDIL